MKRLLSILLCACLFLTAAPAYTAFGAAAGTKANYISMTAAPSQYYIATGTVKTGSPAGLNVRKTPSESGAVCDIVKDGKKLYILKKDSPSGWHQIYYNGYLAYVMSQYVDQVSAVTSNSRRISLGYGVPVKFAGGTGSETNPYIVKTPSQLNSIRFKPDKFYKLGCDIDLSKWGQWLPIGCNIWYNGRARGIASGRDAQYFTGQLNGSGHVIRGMNITISRKTPEQPEPERMDERHFGLFAMTSARYPAQAVLKNLGLVNYNIDVNYSAINCQLLLWAGGFTSSASHCRISKCWTKNGKVRVTVNTGTKKQYAEKNISSIHIGGIAGSASEIKFISCANTGDVTLRTDKMSGASKEAGGITSSGNFIMVEKCFNKGKITMPQTSFNGAAAGGIIAGLCNPHTSSNDHGHIFDSYNAGRISGGHFSGGLTGYAKIGIRLSRCYAIGTVANAGFKGKLYSPKGITAIKYRKNCYTNGKSVSGAAWRNSASLHRKVLKSIPETNIPSSKK